MKRRLILVAILFSSCAQGQAPATPTAVPIPKEPHHHLVLENDYVRVFRVSLPAHDATLVHQHDVPYLYISLGPADVINAVQGRPEARIVMADGQVGYSSGHFAHIARTDAGSSFDNVTIELLHPQGTPRNRCAKIVDGPINNCPDEEQTRDGIASRALNMPIPVLETNEILLTSGSVGAKAGYIQSGSQPAQLLIALDSSGVRVEVRGQLSRAVHCGETLWLPAGNPPAIFSLGEQGSSRFLLLAFRP